MSYSIKKHNSRWTVEIISVLTAFVGIINVFSAIRPALADRLSLIVPYLPNVILNGARLATVIFGFSLIVISIGLRNHKKAAWLLAMVVLIVSIVLHLIKGLDYEEASISLVLVLILWSQRFNFQAESDNPSVWQGLRAALLSLALTLGYGTLGFYLLDRQFTINFSFWQSIKQTLSMFLSFEPVVMPVTRFGRYFFDSVYSIATITMIYVLFMFLRPVLLKHSRDLSKYNIAKKIIDKYGRTNLSTFLLFEGKEYFFDSTSSVVIGYTVRGGIAVVLGDPVGPKVKIIEAINQFKQYCQKKSWQVCFYQVMPDHLDDYQKAEFKIIKVGSEAIVDLNLFSLEGADNKNIRNAFNKIDNLHFTHQVCEPPLDDRLLRELEEISDEWLAIKHTVERSFSLGKFHYDYIKNSSILVLKNSTGEIVAFTNIVREGVSQERVSIDLMRHRNGIENGVMEYLFISLFSWAKKNGYKYFNMGLSPLAGTGINKDDSIAEKAINFIYKNINQFYNFKGLHGFKDKFHPIWSPRYLIYPSNLSLLKVAVALIEADSEKNIWTTLIKKY